MPDLTLDDLPLLVGCPMCGNTVDADNPRCSQCGEWLIVDGKLPPRKTLNGKFDAYCHVCWNPVYTLWIDDTDPAGKCPHGANVVTDCAEAMARARESATIAKLKAQGIIRRL